MQHFNASDFIALKPAKAKAAALAMFAAAQLDAMPDWHAVALALHAAYSPKPRTPKDDIAMADSADAGEFAPWNDLPAPGKGTAQVRGRVTIEFADGYSKTVGLVAGKGKPWSIGKAVTFAVACYQADAARRITGGDDVLYCGEHLLPNLIAVPEIVSVISADSDETAAGDLVWSSDAANAATREMRAGQVDPATADHDALAAARFEIARAMGLMKSAAEIHMARANAEAMERAGAILFPWHRGSRSLEEVEHLATLFRPLMDADPEGFAPAALEGAPVYAADARADLAPADHETMLAATAIVGDHDADVFAPGLSAVSYAERFTLVEDAMLAWAALMEPCAFVDGDPVEAEAERSEDVSAPPAACLDAAGAAEAGASPAAPEAVAEPAPRVKPRYRVTAAGVFELMTEG